MKAGSTTATFWAAELEEGLLRRLRILSREAQEALENGTPRGWIMWYAGRLSEEVFEMGGCEFDNDNMLHQQLLVTRSVIKGLLGAPIALSPTCCSTGVGRLRVAFVRHPFARLWSYFDTYVQDVGNFSGGFEMWVSQLVDEWPVDWTCQSSSDDVRESAFEFESAPDSGIHLICKSPWREASPKNWCNNPKQWRFTYMDWEHIAPIAPAIRAEGHGDPEEFFPFRIESPIDSLALLERRLCDEWNFCPPQGLPPFPSPSKSPASRQSFRTGSAEWPQRLRDGLWWRYRDDFAVFGYTTSWHPRFEKMR